jgi:hypothetical protein
MSSISIATPRPIRARLIALAAFAGALVLLTAAICADMFPVPMTCGRHAGAFSNAFSSEFGIDRIECKSAWMTNSPTLLLYAVHPYVAVEW